MDIETAHGIEGKGRWDVLIALLVAAAAVIGSLLAVLEVHSSKNEERALLESSRRSVQVFTRVATFGILSSMRVNTERAAIDLFSEAQLRALTGTQGWSVSEAEAALGAADLVAAQQLSSLAESLSDPPRGSGLDRQTEAVLGASQDDIEGLVERQNDLVDEAARHGDRNTRATFALSILAVAAVMIALAGMFGRSTQGRLALVTSALLMVLAAGWGAYAAIFV
jgi:hypothetical protein